MPTDPSPEAALRRAADDLARAFHAYRHALARVAAEKNLDLGDPTLNELARDPGRILEAADAFQNLADAADAADASAHRTQPAFYAKAHAAGRRVAIDFSDIENTEPGEARR